jgi:hypothetical protein
MITGKINFWKCCLPVGMWLLVAGACTRNFEELNTNPNEATEDMMATDNLKTGALFSQMERNVILFKDGINLSSDYQVAQGLTSDLYSGYVAPTGTWYGGVNNSSYFLIPGWTERTFTSGFLSVMTAWNKINKAATEQNLPEVAALATILKVEGMHRVADAYGPIPYLSFGNGALQNNYDPLQNVYAKFFEELDGAIDVLTKYALGGTSAPPLMAKFDYIYEGNVTKWVKFANTLRLRLAMRVVYANASLAKTEAEKSTANPIGVITAVNEKAVLLRINNLTYIHPLYEIAYSFNAGEARMSASMDAYMNGYADPRRAAYFTKASDGNYHGVRQGIVTTNWTPYSGPAISNLNMNNSTSIVWMTAAESYFLRAEGALRNWNMGGTAQQFYNQGIAVSFQENSVGADAAAYAADNTLKPIPFTDNSGQSGNNITAPSTITILMNVNDNFETNLEKIITQKWLALYPDGPEGWAEFRRTGYPKLLPVVNNNSNGTISTAVQIRRITYPQSEYNNNKAGVQSGLAALGGPDGGGVKLWWDKK